MRVAFIYAGDSFAAGAILRLTQVLNALTANHDVTLISVREANTPEKQGPLPTSRASGSAEIQLATAPGPLRSRLQPSHRRPEPDTFQRLRSVTADADWVWLGVWPLNWSPLAVKWREQGKFVSWDEDSLSRSRFTAARALWLRNPARATTRLAAATASALAERRHLGSMSLVTARSMPDRNWLARIQQAPVTLLRNAIDLRSLDAVRRFAPVERTKRKVLFVGSDYEPNVDGIEWFVRRVWPRVIDRDSSASLTIVGRGIERHAPKLQATGVTVVGSVEDTRPFVAEARLVVVPVFYGAGSLMKVLEAAAAARPVVASSFAAASAGHQNMLHVAKSRTDWAGKVTALLESPQLAADEGNAAFETVAVAHSFEQFDRDFARVEELASAT